MYCRFLYPLRTPLGFRTSLPRSDNSKPSGLTVYHKTRHNERVFRAQTLRQRTETAAVEIYLYSGFIGREPYTASVESQTACT